MRRDSRAATTRRTPAPAPWLLGPRRAVAVSGTRQRKRLAIRLEQLKKQHSWGDVTDAEYQAERKLDPDRRGVPTGRRPDPLVRRLSDACPRASRGDRGRVASQAGRALSDRRRARRRERPACRSDRVNALSPTVLQQTAGVPPKGTPAPTRCLMTTLSRGTSHDPVTERLGTDPELLGDLADGAVALTRQAGSRPDGPVVAVS
jgi:hypothetical protein